MFGWLFARTVKFKSAQNVLARRLRRVVQATWVPERGTWVCEMKSGAKAEIPNDHVVVFGKKVTVTA